MTASSKTKYIKIFLSSTFRDMDAERDAIMNRVRPTVAQQLKPHGINVDFIDLRWGVNTQQVPEAERENHVLRECLNSIQESRPFFVALLGDRYGWVPTQQSWDAIVDGMDADERMFINGETQQARSVTELEILFGALMDTDSLQRSFFCFRRDDVYEQMDSTHRSQYCETNGVARQHLAELKGKIADTMHTHRLDHNVMSYGCGWDGQRLTGLDELVSFLSTTLVQEILLYESEDSSDNHEDEFEQLNALTLQHVEASNRLFCGREDWLQWLNEYIDRHDRALLMVAGNDGLGKTALLCRLYAWLEEREGYMPYIYFADRSDTDSRAETPLKCWLADRRRPTKHYCGANTEEEFGLLAHMLGRTFAADGRRNVLLIDDVDAIDDWQQIADTTWIPDNTVVICTSSTADEYGMEGVDTVAIRPLAPDDALALVQRRLRQVGKQLPQAVMDALINKVEGKIRPSAIPLWDVMMVRRLVLLNASYFEAQRGRSESSDEMKIQNSLVELVDAADVLPTKLFSTLLAEGRDFFDLDFGLKVLRYIAISEFGLRESDLQVLMDDEWDGLKWAELKSYLGPLLSINESSGTVDFAYSDFRIEVVMTAGEAINPLLERVTAWLRIVAEHNSLDSVALRELPYLALKTMSEDIADIVVKNKERALRRSTVYALGNLATQRWNHVEHWLAHTATRQPEATAELVIEVMENMLRSGATYTAAKMGAALVKTFNDMESQPEMGATLPRMQALFAESLYRSGDMQTAWAWANWLLVSFLEHAEEHGYGEAVARAIFIAASIWHDSADKIAPTTDNGTATTEGNAPADPFRTDDLRREDMAAWTDYGLNLMQTIVFEECRTDLIRDMRELTAIYTTTEQAQDKDTFADRMYISQTLNQPEWTFKVFYRIRPLMLLAGRMRTCDTYVAETLEAEAREIDRLLAEVAPGNMLFDGALTPPTPEYEGLTGGEGAPMGEANEAGAKVNKAETEASVAPTEEADEAPAEEAKAIEAAETWLYLHGDSDKAAACLAAVPSTLDSDRTDMTAIRAHTVVAGIQAKSTDDIVRRIDYGHKLMGLYPKTKDEATLLAMNDYLLAYVSMMVHIPNHNCALLADMCYYMLRTEHQAFMTHSSGFGSMQAMRLQVTFYMLCSMSDYALEEQKNKKQDGNDGHIMQQLQSAIAMMKGLGLSDVLVVQGYSLAYHAMAYTYEQHGDLHSMMFYNKRHEFATYEAYRLNADNMEAARRYAGAVDETGRLFYMVMHNRRQAEPCFKKAYAMFERLYKANPTGTIVNDLLLSTYNQTLMLSEDHRHEDVCNLAARTLQTVAERHTNSDTDRGLLACLQEIYGKSLAQLGHYDAAERYLREAKQTYSAALDAAPDNEKCMRDMALICNAIANFLLSKGSDRQSVMAEIDEGERLLLRALEIQPDSVKAVGNFIGLLSTKVKALILLRDAAAIAESLQLFDALTTQRTLRLRDTTLVPVAMGVYRDLTALARNTGWDDMADHLQQIHDATIDILVKNRLIKRQ